MWNNISNRVAEQYEYACTSPDGCRLRAIVMHGRGYGACIEIEGGTAERRYADTLFPTLTEAQTWCEQTLQNLQGNAAG